MLRTCASTVVCVTKRCCAMPRSESPAERAVANCKKRKRAANAGVRCCNKLQRTAGDGHEPVLPFVLPGVACSDNTKNASLLLRRRLRLGCGARRFSDSARKPAGAVTLPPSADARGGRASAGAWSRSAHRSAVGVCPLARGRGGDGRSDDCEHARPPPLRQGRQVGQHEFARTPR